ncbi:hypothetical protein C0992_007546 [Termitomyces sp. T32_za158]|nr:hypothetical protein C0992_007546 [Termitomyces sp. T32_za158]
MPTNCTATSGKVLGALRYTIDFEKIGKFEVGAPGETKNHTQLMDDVDKIEPTKYQLSVQASDVGKALHDNHVIRVRGLLGWLDDLKRVSEMLRKKCASRGKQAEDVKPRRRGFYTLLYGGRVNINTFYDYKDTLGDGRRGQMKLVKQFVKTCYSETLVSDSSSVADNEREDGRLISEEKDNATPRETTYHGGLGLRFKFPGDPKKEVTQHILDFPIFIGDA